MDITDDTADPDLPPAGYPRTTDGWVTFQRVPVRGGGVLLVQKRNGCTRTVRA